jgi:hypothetical protein
MEQITQIKKDITLIKAAHVLRALNHILRQKIIRM